MLAPSAKLFFILALFQNLALNHSYSQNSDVACSELLQLKRDSLLTLDISKQAEKRIVEQVINSNFESTYKTDLLEILGEPNQVKRFYDGMEKSDMTAFVYFLRPTYQSQNFVGLTIQFIFKETQDLVFEIKQVRYCE